MAKSVLCRPLHCFEFQLIPFGLLLQTVSSFTAERKSVFRESSPVGLGPDRAGGVRSTWLE